MDRKELFVAPLASLRATSVRVFRITMAPGECGGRHLHECTVFGVITDGIAVYEREGLAPESLHKGSPFYEPAGEVIVRFGNASSDTPMSFIAFYLVDGDKPLITML